LSSFLFRVLVGQVLVLVLVLVLVGLVLVFVLVALILVLVLVLAGPVLVNITATGSTWDTGATCDISDQVSLQ